MKVKFIGPRKIGSKHFAAGIHSLSESEQNHWYAKALLKSGDIIPLEDPPAPPKFELPVLPLGDEPKESPPEVPKKRAKGKAAKG